MIGRHFGHQFLLRHIPVIDEVGKQGIDESFLVLVRMLLITGTLQPAQKIERTPLA